MAGTGIIAGTIVAEGMVRFIVEDMTRDIMEKKFFQDQNNF